MSTHARNAADFIRDETRTDWHDDALWFVRTKRDRAIREVAEWEELRELASQIKDHTLSNLDRLLEQFEAHAVQNGVQVHWAADAGEHNRIVLDILKEHKVDQVVKSKSMLTEECHLNDYLAQHGVAVTDTDLGEHIIQLREEPPSHIVMPAIHLRREEVGTLFHEKLATKDGVSDPEYLAGAAREHLRQRFLTAGAAITGVNFAVAATGDVVVCTNEGNADMGVHLAKVQIHCMGIEKIIPEVQHLAVFLRLLARSATGQASTVYTSHYRRPRPGTEMHVVLVDNGRTSHLGREAFRNGLKCIRCGACMNTCPVYRRSGGHSYGATIPGPIGSILMPGADIANHGELPFASTLCGSCSDVCPVKIDIHDQLFQWRQVYAEEGYLPARKRRPMRMAGKILARPWLYRLAGRAARWSIRWLPRWLLYHRLNVWGRHRELPEPPEQSFRNWYRQNRRRS